MSFKVNQSERKIRCVLAQFAWLSPILGIGAVSACITGIELGLLSHPAQASPAQSQAPSVSLLPTPNLRPQFAEVTPSSPPLESAFSTTTTLQGAQFAGSDRAQNFQIAPVHLAQNCASKPLANCLGDRNNQIEDLQPALNPARLAAPSDAITAGQTDATVSASAIAQTSEVPPKPSATSPPAATSPPSNKVLKEGSLVLGSPYIRFQGVYLLQGDDSSARARFTGLYPILPNLLFGAEVDLTTGNAFTDSPGTGLNLNELYLAYSPPNAPNLRFVGGLMDLTSYFDRNSFAKDGTTHFFNPVFQTNPALSAANISSRPGFLVNWSATDYLDLKAAAFSANRNLGDFAINSFAGEIGVRFDNAIIRGTYVNTKDNGRRTGFEEIFAIPRSNGDAGFRYGDREEAFGVNAEYYIPAIRMGLFGRYGKYNNLTLGQGGDTFSFGANFLDLFMPKDRLGIGYGRQLSNSDLRRQLGEKVPDVLELFYDAQILPNLRAGLTFQERNEFSETIFGFRIKTEFDVVPFRRPFR